MNDQDVPAPTTRDFGFALSFLMAGARVRKDSWRGTRKFLVWVKGSEFAVDRMPLLEVYPAGTVVKYRPHIDLHDEDGTLGPYSLSTQDMVDHWEVLPPETPSQPDAQKSAEQDLQLDTPPSN